MTSWIIFILLGALIFTSGASGKKNVLFFAVDDLRPQLNAYGVDFITSPNIDALASKSMLFERAYCQIAVCSPSRASLLTGRRPDTNHVWQIAADEYWRTVPDATNATTIPQYFKENGYLSIGMGKIFHPGPPSGYDDYKYSWSPEGRPYFHAKEDSSIAKGAAWYSFDEPDNKRVDGQIADNAVNVLQQIKKNRTEGDDRPFFVAVGFHKPHLPFYCSSKYYDLYPSIEDTKLPENPDVPKGMPDVAFTIWKELKDYSDIKAIINETLCDTDAEASIYGKECHVPDNKMKELRRAYYSCVSFTDAQIGRVIKELDAQGFADDTIIILWGDHGWQLGEHNQWGKCTNFEDATHVPFLLHVPGVTDNGMTTKALVELIDIFPSLTELAGLEVPPMCTKNSPTSIACVEGSSVVPLLSNPNAQWKKGSFSQYPRPSTQGLPEIPGKPPFDPSEKLESVMGYTVRTDKYRFTEWYKFNRNTSTPNFNDIWGTELYDHSSPTVFFNDENVNLATESEMKPVVDELRQLLQAGWREALPPTN
ncbi:PREDICTED: iduronate 2-sulfatase-like [Amphimedon queenslandica]|uniref:Sulfatase N-terminal domain-containing protein n=1 Tax=Amphimedon queenslandica TaxID=400682 RepID=A0A1X7UIP3_AMPQE|nr:PREDICTED: iduronate 2-sulfatase-like [Amphimedon queenslandica]|eukprot:XP_003387744.1 PREDICTED: iduronate 2-sulfatase-like [Amphimedon queenslandica]